MTLADKKAWGWYLSFFTFFSPRYVLTPFATITRMYDRYDVGLSYRDYYVFGFRVARIHKV